MQNIKTYSESEIENKIEEKVNAIFNGMYIILSNAFEDSYNLESGIFSHKVVFGPCTNIEFHKMLQISFDTAYQIGCVLYIISGGEPGEDSIIYKGVHYSKIRIIDNIGDNNDLLIYLQKYEIDKSDIMF